VVDGLGRGVATATNARASTASSCAPSERKPNWPVSRSPTAPSWPPGRIIVNFETPDVQSEFDRIKGLGARVEHEPYQPGDGGEMWLATFEDPDGNFFQLASPMSAP
jgi:Glyoxalase-like domain